jgi:hypothetical protein
MKHSYYVAVLSTFTENSLCGTDVAIEIRGSFLAEFCDVFSVYLKLYYPPKPVRRELYAGVAIL